MGSSNKTKDWLKNQLVSHGVPLPASTAKKEEYQRLYDEQVLPKQNNTEFSSDDDTEETSSVPTKSPLVAHNIRPDTKTQNGTDASTDRHTAWVHRLSDKNLFTALKANGKEVGGIVESTRLLYENMLVDMLNKDEQSTLHEIENYLSQNQDAKEFWLKDGVELNGGFNGIGVTNGNSANGFSDSDDDDTVETASRASRSSRASSKRQTPIRSSVSSPPVKESTPTHRSFADSNAKPRRVTGVRDDPMDDINEVDDDQAVITASSSRSPYMSDSLLYNRVSSPSDSSIRFNKPYTMRKTVVETVEKTRTHVFDSDSTDNTTFQQRQRNASPKATGWSKAVVILKYVLLLITVLVVPVIAYYIFNQPDNSANCEGSDCTSDDLDVILQSLNNEEASNEA